MSEISIIKNIDELISTIDQDFENFANLLDQVIADVVKDPKHIASFITYINTNLSYASTRKRGVSLLNAFIPLCPYNHSTEHATAWINNSLKYCEGESTLQSTAYDVISQLLKICVDIPELYKEITSGILAKVIEQIKITPHNTQSVANALRCLEICLQLYAGPCGPFKNSLEKYLISFVDCTFVENVHLAGKCLHSVQQTGGGGTQGNNHKLNWKRQQESLCVTIHTLMNELFESVIELNHVNEKEDILPLTLPKLPVGEPIKIISRRITNVTIFLIEMLLGAFPTGKIVLPNIILKTISRGLIITSSSIRNTIMGEAIYLSANLYIIHKSLLKLLQALIVCLGTNLLPFAVRISKLLINNLKHAASKNTGNVTLYCDLQIVIYQTLCIWMNTTKSASCIDELSENLLTILTKDCSTVKNEISLRAPNSSTKGLSKKAKRQQQIASMTMNNAYNPATKNYAKPTNTLQHKLCRQALIVVQSLLKNSGHLLKPTIHKQLQEFVVKTLYELQRGDITKPYDNGDCKLELYKTLSCLVSNHHFNITPPLSYAVLLFSKGQCDRDPKISSFCTTTVANLNNFIHPTHATLQLPLEIESRQDEFIKEVEMKDLPPVISCIEIMEIEPEIIEKEPENVKSVQETVEIEESTSQDASTSEVSSNTNKDNSEPVKEMTDTEDVIEITSDQNKSTTCSTQDSENVYQNQNRSINKSSFSVQIEILSDDEVMEQLTINDEPDTSEPQTNEKQSPKKNVKGKEDDNIINLEEEEMCSSFVNIVNE